MVRVYLDSSALVKLVKLEPKSGALRRFLRQHHTDGRVTTGAPARVEVVPAVAAGGPAAVAQGEGAARPRGPHQHRSRPPRRGGHPRTRDDRALSGCHHLASARSIGADLRAVVTYDRRMADAAAALSLVVETPALPGE